LDESLRLEHNDEASAFADWVHLAQRVDAEIRILQDEDVVTRVEVLLPRGEGQTGETSESGRTQIWLVQDNLEAARAVTQMLPPKDYALTHLRGGQELREHFAVAPVPPDAVILEYNLPDVRGSVLRTWLYEQDPDLPVILISGFESTHPGIATASNLPSTQYLQKPFDADALLDQLRMVIRETLPGMD
jgi:CheY-like chemotaxis protein